MKVQLRTIVGDRVEITVVTPCCEGVVHMVGRDEWCNQFVGSLGLDGVLYAGLSGGEDNGWIEIPFRCCPSCGALVEIVAGGPA